MPYRFIDFLIEMTDPQNLARFKENPDAAMNAAGLSAVEKAAVMSGKSGWIRLLGKREIEKDNGTESLQDGLSANEHIGQSDIERDDVPQQLDVTQELDVTQQLDVTQELDVTQFLDIQFLDGTRSVVPEMEMIQSVDETEASPRTMKKTGSLVIVGTGIKGVAHMTMETRVWIEQADKVLYCVGDVSTERWIKKLNAKAESLYVFYGDDKLRMQSYNQMVDRILECVREGLNVCAAFYGHSGVFVYPSHESIRRARLEGYAATLLPGISSDACLFADLGIDPSRTGCLSLEATDYLVRRRKLDPTVAVILWQGGCVGDVGFKSTGFDGRNIPVLAEALQEQYGQDYEVIIYEAPQYAVCNPGIRRVALSQLTEARLTGISTLYIPPKEKPGLDQEMMKRLGLIPRPKPKKT